MGLDAAIWKILLAVLVLPMLVVGALNLLLRRRGGLGPGWGGVLALLLAGLVSLLIILDKIRL